MTNQRSNIFSSEIHNLKLQTIQKRLMQTGITLAAISLPLTALIAPNQSTDMKLWELGLGSLFGGCGAFVAKEREDIENRHSSFLDLHREHEKGSIKNEFGFYSATQEMRGELNLAGAINALQQPSARLRYMNKFQLQGLIEPPQREVQTATIDTTSEPIPITATRKARIDGDIQWLLQIAVELTDPILSKRKHHHFIVHGGTQSGKSTLVSALIILASSLLAKQDTPTEINLIDPKFPETDWFIEPSYQDYSEVLDGLQHTFEQLQELKTQAKKAGVSLSDTRGFHFVVIDEQDNIFSNGQGYPDKIDKNDVKRILNLEKALIKEGASYNFCQIVIGQSPLNTDSGFNRSIYRNVTHIVLGDTALTWCQDMSFPYKEHAQRLIGEIGKFQRAKERFGLIMPKGGIPFVTRISPEIRQIIDYEKSKTATSVEDEETHSDETDSTPKLTTDPKQQVSKADINLLHTIQTWYFGVFKEFGHYPNDATLAQAWSELTGETLSENGINYLRERIHK